MKRGKERQGWGETKKGMKWRHKFLQKSLLTPESRKYFLTLLHRVNISIKIAYLILPDKHLHGNVMIIHWNHLLSWLSPRGLPKREVSSLLCLFIYFHRKRRYNSRLRFKCKYKLWVCKSSISKRTKSIAIIQEDKRILNQVTKTSKNSNNKNQDIV